MSLLTTFNRLRLMTQQTQPPQQKTTKEIEFALTLRDYLIQFVNEYFEEENYT